MSCSAHRPMLWAVRLKLSSSVYESEPSELPPCPSGEIAAGDDSGIENGWAFEYLRGWDVAPDKDLAWTGDPSNGDLESSGPREVSAVSSVDDNMLVLVDNSRSARASSASFGCDSSSVKRQAKPLVRQNLPKIA